MVCLRRGTATTHPRSSELDIADDREGIPAACGEIVGNQRFLQQIIHTRREAPRPCQNSTKEWIRFHESTCSPPSVYGSCLSSGFASLFAFRRTDEIY